MFFSKEKAEAEGNALLARMKGRGWKLRVWQNFGWHYSIYNGSMNVHPTQNSCLERYYTLLGDNKHKHAGCVFWSMNGKTYKDPNDAVEEQLNAAWTFLGEHAKIVENIQINISME